MDITVNVTGPVYLLDPSVCGRLAAMDEKLDRVLEGLEMAKYADAATKAAVDEVLAQINSATNTIAAKLAALEAKLAGPGLTAEESAEVLSQLAALRAQLEALGADPDNPVPEPVA